ncbi:hypothetical protein VZT92_017637 [Zoarces viviparus]|uniref:Uncharacterized protein n=1 Tax=Zoarces viviparus TaxID=48416 RepID=A0AAW1EP00_ZOAVI
MPDSPAHSHGLISCYRPCLPLFYPPRLTPGKPTCLLILILINSACCTWKPCLPLFYPPCLTPGKPTSLLILTLFELCLLISTFEIKGQRSLKSRVLHLGPYTTRYITIWPVMDPAHTPTPVSRFERIEGALQQHEVLMTNIAAETRQSAAAQEQAMAALAAQVQQLQQPLCRMQSQLLLLFPRRLLQHTSPVWEPQSAMLENLRAAPHSSRTAPSCFPCSPTRLPRRKLK